MAQLQKQIDNSLKKNPSVFFKKTYTAISRRATVTNLFTAIWFPDVLLSKKLVISLIVIISYLVTMCYEFTIGK